MRIHTHGNFLKIRRVISLVLNFVYSQCPRFCEELACSFTVEIYDGQQLVSTDEYDDLVELGRSETSADALR